MCTALAAKPLTSVTVTPTTPASGKRLPHLVYFEGLDDGDYQFHAAVPM